MIHRRQHRLRVALLLRLPAKMPTKTIVMLASECCTPIDRSRPYHPAAVASPEHPAVARVIEVVREATGGEVRIVPLMGGSLPISAIGEVLGAPFVIAPIVNADNSQHAPNENLRMKEFRRGIELYAALLALAGWRGP